MILIKTYLIFICLDVLIICAHLHLGRRRKSEWYVNERGQLITSKTNIMTPAQTDYNWLMNIIDSANNDFHFICIDKMIGLFFDKHKDENMTDLLMMVRDNTWNRIHSILK